MSIEKKDYVVYGMRVKCSEGTMENYISTDVGHGVTYQKQPLLNANDHTKQTNLTHFGDCNSKMIYEEAKKQADEKYKADEDDGFFAKAGKWFAKTVTKVKISVQEHLMFHKCELDTPLPWMFCNEEHMIDGAPALTVESQCPCRRGGVITIVPVVEEETAIGEVESTTVEGVVKPLMAEPAEGVVKPLMAEPAEGVTNSLMAGALEGVMKSFMPEVVLSGQELTDSNKGKVKAVLPRGGISNLIDNPDQESVEKELKRLEELCRTKAMSVLEAYVNEETLGKINPEWTENMDKFKEVYGEDVFEQMREQMYKYDITSETSILMFLSTIGEETGYGTNVIQGYGHQEYENEEYRTHLEEVPQIDNSLGIGLVQITGDTQGYFIKDLYNSLEKGDPERGRIEEYFGVTEEYFSNIPSYKPAKLENMAGFICMYYPIESSMWFWGRYEKCALFGENNEQTNYSINDYIDAFQGSNLNNVFLGMQYAVNSLPQEKYTNELMTKGDVRDICDTQDDLAIQESKEIVINGETYRMPNGWDDRMADWSRAHTLLTKSEEE